MAVRIADATHTPEYRDYQTMRACHPWIDRVRLSAAWQLKQTPDQLALGLRGEDGDTRSGVQLQKAPLTSGASVYLVVCSSSKWSVSFCWLDHPALSRAFHAKRRLTANYESLSFHCS